MHQVLLHFGEISLKGKNKHEFVDVLISSIKTLARYHNIESLKIKALRNGIILTSEDSKQNLHYMLSHLYGIANYYFIETTSSQLEEILSKAEELIEEAKKRGTKTLSIQTKRSDKGFPLTSPQINKQIGDIITQQDLEVDYKNGEETLFIKIGKKETHLSLKKYKALGGLPNGSTGKALCLLSGGIDSPVAANLMMKRGMHVDYLHFHAFANNELVKQSKIQETIEKLNQYQGKAKLYTLPTSLFEMYAGNIRYNNYEVILFKHFIFHFAQILAKEQGYDAIITGDSLAQVASQTTKNITTTTTGITTPIFRPLLSYDKEEIVQKSRDFDLFDIAVKQYKDCCSLLAKKPTTSSNYEKLKILLKDCDFEEILTQSKKEMDEFKIF